MNFKSLFRIIRREDPRWLFWSVYYPFNFGDWIGPFLYKHISNKDPWYTLPSSYNRSKFFMSVGSILKLARENCIVWGSGIKNRNVYFPKPYRILSVRGPYTRERCKNLGYACPEVYGDPGILLPKFYQPEKKDKVFDLGIIPHFRDFEYIKQQKKYLSNNILVIDVRYPIERIIDCIVSCKRIISSSLHGIVVSHAYGVPVGWVSFGKKVDGDGVKFLDHYASVNINNVECLEKAHEYSVDELFDFVDSAPTVCVEPMAKSLLAACPFPFNFQCP